MIINNSAHKLYLSNKLQYSNIIKYIMRELYYNSEKKELKSFNSIFKFLISTNHHYKTNV